MTSISRPSERHGLTEDINKLQLRLTISQTITSVILAYRELMRAQDEKRLADDAVVRAKALVDIDRTMINAGRMARNGIVQAQAALENQKAVSPSSLTSHRNGAP
ncbi:MAG: hypothetical protein WDN29_02695 [Methylovirgula sp.]